MSHRWAACRGLMLASLLCLAGSPLYAEEVPATKGAKSVPRRYVLRYRANYTCTYPVGASDVVKASGSITFQVPPGGGAVAATGSFRHVGTGYVFAGPLILKGQGSGGFLEFTFPAGFSGGQRVYNRTDALRLELKDGATVNVPFKPIPGVAAHCAGECRLTIEKPVDRWRITVDDYRVEYAIDEGPAREGIDPKRTRRAGLSLHIRRVVEVTIEKRQFKKGHGVGRYVSIRNYSDPPWAYTCKAAVTEVRGTGTDIEAERFDQAHWAKRFHPPKTPLDAALKKAWESIKLTRTPAITPESYTVQGTVSGQVLDLRLPKPFTYTVSIYGKLNVEAVKKHGFTIGPSKKREFLALQRGVLASAMRVTLRDGWSHSSAKRGERPRTTMRVEQIE